MKDIINAIEKYNEVNLELNCKEQQFEEEGMKKASEKLQVLYLELKPYIDLYKILQENERQTIKIIIKEEETYSKSPFIYLDSMCKDLKLCTYENGHNKVLSEYIILSEDDYRYFCILTPLIQSMDIQKIKEAFKKEIINTIKRATRSKENKMVKTIDALSAFHSNDKITTLSKQLEKLFKLKHEYKSTNNEFGLCLVFNQIEKIEKMIKGGEN